MLRIWFVQYIACIYENVLIKSIILCDEYPLIQIIKNDERSTGYYSLR